MRAYGCEGTAREFREEYSVFVVWSAVARPQIVAAHEGGLRAVLRPPNQIPAGGVS